MIMSTMRAARIHDFGGPDVLQIDTVERPEPRPSEVLVEVHAASVNPVDYKTRSGEYPVVSHDQLPKTLGRDVSGLVVGCGRDVRGFQVGDAVYAMLPQEQGGFAEYAAFDAGLCAPKPATLDHTAAAAVPLAALTAWQGLFDHGQLQAGQTVLIHGGAGGVGHLAIQFAKIKGARVITTASETDLEFVRELGADVAIDYKAQHFEREVDAVDMVFDLIAGETRRRSWSVLRPGGILVSTLGKPSEDEARKHHARGAGYLAQPSGAQLAEIARLIDRGEVRPIVQAHYPLAQLREAEELVERGHPRGKVVVNVIEPAAA
jgi:NADPH:quinone reductase-like Zn-dependent oxidoreductase